VLSVTLKGGEKPERKEEKRKGYVQEEKRNRGSRGGFGVTVYQDHDQQKRAQFKKKGGNTKVLEREGGKNSPPWTREGVWHCPSTRDHI